MKLSTRLIILFLLLSLTPLLGIGYIGFRNGIDTMKTQTMQRLVSINNAKAAEVNRWINACQSHLKSLAQRPEERTHAYSLVNGSISVEKRMEIRRQILENHFIPSIEAGNGFVDLSLLNKRDGQILVSTNRQLEGLFREDTDFFKKGQKGTFVDDVSYSLSTEQLVMHVSTPVVDTDGNLIAVLAGHVDWNEMSKIMLQTSGMSRSEESYIVNKFNFFVTASRFVDDYRLDKSVHTKGTAQCLAHHKGVESYIGYHGHAVIGAYRWMPKWELCIITEEDEGEALAAAIHFRKVVIGMGAVLSIVMVAVSLFFARTLTNRIGALVRGAKEFAQGNFNYRIPPISPNEIGQLADAYNLMARVRQKAEIIIKKSHDELEMRVRMLHNALTCKTEEDVASSALEIAKEQTGCKFGFIGEINAAGLMDTIAFSNPDEKEGNIIASDAKRSIKNKRIRGIDRAVLREGKSRIVNTAQMRTHLERAGVPWGHPRITSFLGVPLKHGERTVGMIALANKEDDFTPQDQEFVEALSIAFYEALEKKRMEIAVAHQSWIKAGQTLLNERMRGDKPLQALADSIMACLAEHVGAEVGALFIAEQGRLKLYGRYAYRGHDTVPESFAWGEGLIGQAAADQRPLFLQNVPENYVVVGSALGQSIPKNIVVVPCLYDGRVKGVVELGVLQFIDQNRREFLDRAAEGIAIAIQTAQARERQKLLLEKTQRQAEELKAQQEELRVTNEELEEQAQRLQASEEILKGQQEELKAANEELKEKNEMLEQHRIRIEQAKRAVEANAAELALSSKYKSQFLANMSHELRSPLNSLLLLAQGLVENREGNLTEDQLVSAKVIHDSGTDLLSLINDILDLAKVEGGRIDLNFSAASISEMAERIRSAFRHMAEEKGLTLEVHVDTAAPAEITTDTRRVEQIIRNLVANAVKFTETGGITITFAPPGPDSDLSCSGLDPEQVIQIAVQDTGIGIAPEHQKMIYEAFKQVDGGTDRSHGGTGLGLSISKELAGLLGGEIQMTSQVAKGSVFSLYLPIARRTAKSPAPAPCFETRAPASVECIPAAIADDRETLEPGDRLILVVEDDPAFARMLFDTCHGRGLKCVAAVTGEAGLELAGNLMPDGIIIDIRLPGMDGWTLLDALKADIRTRHIPVHVISVEEAAHESLRKGAIGHTTKPSSHEEILQAFSRIEETAAQKPKRVLVVEDDEAMRRRVKQLIGNGDVRVDQTSTGQQALEALRAERYECLILDLSLPDMEGGALLKQAEDESLHLPPVIVHTARDLTEQEERNLRERAESIVIKGVRSQERLLDEVSLFLHRTVKDLPESKRQIIQNLHETDALLKDKKVLIVDDDMRATFAIARLLSEHGMQPIKAENGERALRLLDREPDLDVVLMDIMMPKMDGYETMRRIRDQDRFRNLPLIALTAKAMPEDRARCINAGANDYLSKPVDAQRLVSLMRVWLYR
jgi:CheY-like chemotaxis protein/signal transduction histidine kinase/HAMP domain-containing protein